MFDRLARAVLTLFAVAYLVGLQPSVHAKFIRKDELHARQAEAAARIKANLPRSVSGSKKGAKNITFTDPRASGTSCSLSQGAPSLGQSQYSSLSTAFYVDGTTIPDVNWDIGPSWSGLMPISSHPNETRKVNKSGVVFNVVVLTETSLCQSLL